MKKLKRFVSGLLAVVGLSACFSFTACGDKACAHEYGEWEVDVAAGCTTDGVNVRTCTLCGDEETATASATGHSYEAEYVEVSSGTYNRNLLCSVCSDKKITVTLTSDVEGLTFVKGSDKVGFVLKYTLPQSDVYTVTVDAGGNDNVSIGFYRYADDTCTNWHGSTFGRGVVTHSGYTPKGENYWGITVENESDEPVSVTFSISKAE